MLTIESIASLELIYRSRVVLYNASIICSSLCIRQPSTAYYALSSVFRSLGKYSDTSLIMRYSSIYLLFANSFAPTFAELTCLQWAFISPLVSAMCCFTPSTAGKVEDTAKTVGTATIAGVKSAVDDVKDLVQFELTHNVVSVAYNFGNIAHNSGWSSAQEYLKNTTQDDAEVALGFAKESIQQAYTIMNLQNWNDFAYCAIKDATKQAISASNKRRGLKKRKISDVDAAGIFKGCLNEKFAKGPHFNTSSKISRPVFPRCSRH